MAFTRLPSPIASCFANRNHKLMYNLISFDLPLIDWLLNALLLLWFLPLTEVGAWSFCQINILSTAGDAGLAIAS